MCVSVCKLVEKVTGEILLRIEATAAKQELDQVHIFILCLSVPKATSKAHSRDGINADSIVFTTHTYTHEHMKRTHIVYVYIYSKTYVTFEV
jgi:hypothetical protein